MRLSWNEIRARAGGFASERERVEHLFGLYEKMTAPLAVKQKPKRQKRKR